MRKQNTWGDIYYKWLRKGYDNGYAAYKADCWARRQARVNCVGRHGANRLGE